MISIHGGEWRGKKIKVLESKDLRPTSSRVKSAIFSIIDSIVWKRTGEPPDFTAWRCLDLFAGVGGLGFEILSRGAAEMVFVEKNRKHFQILEENIRTLQCRERTKTILGDVLNAPWEKMGPFDLILADAPYNFQEYEKISDKFAATIPNERPAILLIEHDPKFRVPEFDKFDRHSERELGPAGITVFVSK